jgi:hypothetical protein
LYISFETALFVLVLILAYILWRTGSDDLKYLTKVNN